MKRLLTGLAASAAVWAIAPAAAQPTRDYYAEHAARTAAPRQLDQQAREYYAAVFAAIDRKDWNGAAALLAQRPDGLLHPVARAELYLAAGSPRVYWLTHETNAEAIRLYDRIAAVCRAPR